MKTTFIAAIVAFSVGGFAAVAFFGRHEINSRSPASIGDMLLHETPVVLLQSYASPDGRYVATVAFKYDNPRFEGHYWSMVSLDSIQEGRSLGRGPQTIRLYGSTSIDCEWRDAKHLRIIYSGKLDRDCTKNLLPECEGITIEYVDLLRSESRKENGPNQTPEPTPTAVMPRAGARVTPASGAAHL